ncbi:hypothetical protein PHET_09405 [Paragonimus heterotremus]|uniref:Uncharacterized protein n=1 Tax=Paragonimus heterotremus TaxID=100268 RepID=A0A8J4SL99_9TREM|nr:hypothetical protein PHET_09405 [Paragonimus heterotremus]
MRLCPTGIKAEAVNRTIGSNGFGYDAKGQSNIFRGNRGQHIDFLQIAIRTFSRSCSHCEASRRSCRGSEADICY